MILRRSLGSAGVVTLLTNFVREDRYRVWSRNLGNLVLPPSSVRDILILTYTRMNPAVRITRETSAKRHAIVPDARAYTPQTISIPSANSVPEAHSSGARSARSCRNSEALGMKGFMDYMDYITRG